MKYLFCAVCFVLAMVPSLTAETITMDAFGFNKDNVWENRDGALGIVGNHRVTSGKCWKDFPGTDGDWKVEFNIVAERDGAPKYKVSVAGKAIKSGSYPYACGKLMCNASKSDCPDKSMTIACGTVPIRKGDRIELWGESTYPCGADHGSYCRWKSFKFTRMSTSVEGASHQSSRSALPPGVLIVDDLTDGKTGAKVSGGSFVSRGWDANGGNLAFDCGKVIAEGGAQVWVTNFNPPKQSTSDKHMFFAGRTAQIDDDKSEKADWWAFRAGTNYNGGSNGTMKVLSNVRGQDSEAKVEARVLGSQTYNLSSTYRLKAKWKSSRVEVFLDGKSVWSHSWGSKPFEIRFVNVGKDIYHGYVGLRGPIYSRFVMWEGPEPSGLESINEGATDFLPAARRLDPPFSLFRTACGYALTLPEALRTAPVTLRDLGGRVVGTILPPADGPVEIATGNLPAGVYLFRAGSGASARMGHFWVTK